MDTPRRISEAQMRFIKPALRLFTRLHVFLYKLTGGKLFNRMGGGAICIVAMTGARSGVRIEFPLMYVPYKDGIVLVASLAGAPRHPVWYHNLVKHPDIEVTVGRETRRLVARIGTKDEKADVWPLCCRVYPDFDLYQRRTTREIPVFICEPASGPA
jgi:deazaflavin-dependent oxidoreductase (nitroreductase family)